MQSLEVPAVPCQVGGWVLLQGTLELAVVHAAMTLALGGKISLQEGRMETQYEFYGTGAVGRKVGGRVPAVPAFLGGYSFDCSFGSGPGDVG